ncbi:alpha/beta fold hydrolase [Agrococcus beijingensis]|uniref:alpha/beta fold hydrolase n=1 Tax=Agrococcus beijingensis TaxID=3068634 RepID=UPI0027407E81|nr:alpha/beta hydrolase [Agrococcus sp. REN33]
MISSVLVAFRERIRERAADAGLARALRDLESHEVAFVSGTGAGAAHGVIAIGAHGIEFLREHAGAEPLPQLTATGSEAAWEALLAGERSWVASTNAALGSIRIAGDPVVWAWLTPILSRLFAPRATIAVPVGSIVGAHADTSTVTGRYVEVRGVQAYYEATVVANPAADEVPPVLLLHTAGRDGRQWHAVMERLGASHRLYAPDLPGHGKSWPQHPEPCLSDIEEIARWLLEFMTAVGHERFVVAGTSVGGNLALLLPALSSRVLGSVAFQGSDHSPTISETALQLMEHPRVSLPFSSMDQALSLVGERAVPEARAIIEWSILTLSPPPQRGDLTAYTRTDTRHLMASIGCPVTLVHGDQDWLATREMVEAAASRIVNAPDLQVVTMPGIGHYPHLEAPDTAAALIEQMARSVQPG